MPAFTRATGMAAVALVAVVGAGGLILLSSKAPNGSVGGPASPPATSTPTSAPTSAPTPAPSSVAPGITGWKPYDSRAYGISIPYPADWTVDAPATTKWQPGEAVVQEGWPFADVFVNSAAIDGDTIGMLVWEAPAPAKADITTWQGLQAAVLKLCKEPTFGNCVFDSPPTPMCIGQSECIPSLIAPVTTEGEVNPWGFIGLADGKTIMVFEMGRPDSFPAAARYGGTTALLRSILTQQGVRSPQPGETPFLEGG